MTGRPAVTAQREHELAPAQAERNRSRRKDQQ